MELIFLWGPAAAGKLTIGRQLSAITGLSLFHNHLVVDALLEKLPFGDPEFIRLREAMWMVTFDTTAKAGRSLIFTFAPEPTVAPDFPQRVVEVVQSHGGAVRFVRLTVSIEDQEKRINAPSRREFRKLTSLDMLRSLQQPFAKSEALMPPADLTLDTSALDPDTAARQIAAAFGLSA